MVYSAERLNNWIKRLEEAENDEEVFKILDQFVEDVVIACLSLLRALNEREIRKGEAIEQLKKAERVFDVRRSFGEELKDEFFAFSVESAKAVLRSFRYYLEGKSSKKSFESLLKEALKSEAEGDLEAAMDAVARMGAKVIKGEKLPELDINDGGIVLSWIDGVDAISTVIELSRIDAPTE
ncbi:MAG: DUF2150 family protein [Archaeoglobaceae archaeon]